MHFEPRYIPHSQKHPHGSISSVAASYRLGAVIVGFILST